MIVRAHRRDVRVLPDQAVTAGAGAGGLEKDQVGLGRSELFEQRRLMDDWANYIL